MSSPVNTSEGNMQDVAPHTFQLNQSQKHELITPSLADADVIYIPHFLTPIHADQLYQQLMSEIPFREERIKLFGKSVSIPRLQSFHGDPLVSYTYSQKTFDAAPWTPGLKALKATLQNDLQLTFNGVLCNLYRNGSDSVGWHSDDEKELGMNPVIASISLGAHRLFSLQHKREKDKKWQMSLAHGSVLIMQGETQHHWRHQLPKQASCKQSRINLTFRNIIP